MAELHMEIVPDLSAVKPSTVQDQKVGRLIEMSESEDFSDALERYDDWAVYYHLSDIRRGILSWYPFAPNSRILEIEGEFGAVTGLLCDSCVCVSVTESNPYRAACIARRYRDRENLKVYAGHIADLSLLRQDEKFDYIFLSGALERYGNGDPNKNVYAAYLQYLRDELLKPNGRFLIAVENRLGLHYFCGDRDSFTGRPFDSINNYPFGSSARGFTKKELSDVLRLTGLKSTRFFYPLPDHRLPQIICSEDCTTDPIIGERLSTYAVHRDTQVVWERSLYKDVLENGALDFMANSFLVECSVAAPCSDINLVILSADRGPLHSFATIIRNNGTVEKKTLYPQGIESLKNSCDASEALSSRGIFVIPHKLVGRSLIMPYMKMQTLEGYLQNIFRENPYEFFKLMDHLYHCILASSELVPAADNTLKTFSGGTDFGPILRTAYIDMVPANCFFDGQSLFFFDQEFVKQNFPARYTMYRAIKYTYMYIDGLEAVVPLQEMKQHFWLNELWDIFESVEETFIAETRSIKKHQAYYRCVYPNLNEIHKRGELLGYRGESFLIYNRSNAVAQVQQVQLKLLCALQEVCDRYNLQYFIIYGTLLGAVRHGGFIPWDDDIDIALPRSDYDRLLNVAIEAFEKPIFLQTMYNDPGCFYGGYSKLRDNSTTALEEQNWNRNCSQGICLDIFPIDRAYSTDALNLRMVSHQCFFQRLLFAKTYGNSRIPKDLNPIKYAWYQGISKKYTREELCNKLESAFEECRQEDSPVRAIFAHYTGGKTYRCFDQHEFDKAITMDFEDLRLPAPQNYTACLRQTYGENFLRYPPISERNAHHNFYYRTDVPYDRFLSRFDLFSDIENCDIVLYGNGPLLKQYLKHYGDTHRPAFIIADRENLWETELNGIEIKRPESIGDPGPCPHRVIICEEKFEPLEQNLRRMGCSNFAYFMPDISLLWSRLESK